LLQLQRYQEKQMKGGGIENSMASNQTHHSSPAATTPRPPSRKRPAPSSNVPATTAAAAAATATATPTSVQASGGDEDKDDKDWVETPRKRPALKQENRETTPK